MALTLAAAPITDYAIIVDRTDNVAIVKTETTAGLELSLPDGREMCVNSVVPSGHRFATRTIPVGEFVLQYGQPIGTSLGIGCGDAITHENMSDDVPVIRAVEILGHVTGDVPERGLDRRRGCSLGIGAEAYLTKPLDVRRLLELMDETLTAGSLNDVG